MRLLKIFFIFLFPVSIFAQEVLYEYNPIQVKRTNRGYVYTQTIARPFKVIKQGEWILNISRKDTIKYRIKGIKNYVGKGINGIWQDNFEVSDVDSFTYEVEGVDIEADTGSYITSPITKEKIKLKPHFKFKKNGKVIATLTDVKALNKYRLPVELKTVKKVGKKAVHKFEYDVRFVDPTWSWQPDATDGKDTYVISNNPTTNYGTSEDLYVMANNYDGTVLIEFPGLVDSLTGGPVVVDSAYIRLYAHMISVVGGSFNVFATPLIESWNEGTVTYNTKPDSIGNTTYNSDTLSSSIGVDVWWNFNVTKSVQAFASEILSYYGWEIAMVELTDNRQLAWYSSDYATASERPKIEVYYTIPSGEGELKGIIPKVYKGTIIPKVDKGVIKPKVRAP